MPRDARRSSGFIKVIPVPSIARYELGTNLPPQEEAFGWLDYVSEVEEIGVEFLKARGHTKSPQNSFRLFQAFLRQAKTFYKSAENLDTRSSPLNYYYSFLNLAKAYVLVNQPQYTGRASTHGLRYRLKTAPLSKQILTVAGSGVYPALYREVIGASIKSEQKLNVAKLLGYCTDVGLEYQMGRFGSPKLVPAKLIIRHEPSDGQSWILLAIASFGLLEPYKKSLTGLFNLMEEVNLHKDRAREYFDIWAEHLPAFKFFENKQTYSNIAGNQIPSMQMINDLIAAIQEMHIVRPHKDEFNMFLCTPLHVRNQVPMKEPLAIYALYYFLASLVRYHPQYLESILASADAWIIDRFARSAPVSLLLYMRNLIEGRNVAYVRY